MMSFQPKKKKKKDSDDELDQIIAFTEKYLIA